MTVWMEVSIAFVVLVVAILVMNRGNPFFVNLKAQDEPVVVALGALTVLSSDLFASTLGGSRTMWLVVGTGVALLGVIARYTNLLDFKNVV